MFLLTFTMLIIAVLGVYAQVLGLQTSRLYAQQSAVAQTMLVWHGAAVSMARSVLTTNAAGYAAIAGGPTSGCSLTATRPPGVVATYPFCPPPIFAGAPVNGTVTDGTPALNRITATQCANLPTQGAGCVPVYDIVNYQFYSVLYQDAASSTNFVITFVEAPVIGAANPAPGLLTLAAAGGNPGGTRIGLTSGDLFRQLRNTSAPSFTYGTVNAAGTQLGAGGGITYTLPASIANATSRAIAVISSAN